MKTSAVRGFHLNQSLFRANYLSKHIDNQSSKYCDQRNECKYSLRMHDLVPLVFVGF